MKKPDGQAGSILFEIEIWSAGAGGGFDDPAGQKAPPSLRRDRWKSGRFEWPEKSRRRVSTNLNLIIIRNLYTNKNPIKTAELNSRNVLTREISKSHKNYPCA
jgi:hypothetical protein